jgi:GNAT superfamily N-acetyltransferase
VDVDEIEAFFSEQGVCFAVGVPPGRETLERELEGRGYERGYAWMKFARPVGDPPGEPPTELRVERAGPEDADALALVECEAYGMPDAAPLWAAATGAPGTHAFIAWAGGEPAAAGLVHVDGAYAWLGGGATRPAFRRRGGQGAVLAARLRLAKELGARTLVTETGEQAPGRPSNSYRNILRHGFREQYLRPNWIAPA